jgi:AraC-like DNA-binding protein
MGELARMRQADRSYGDAVARSLGLEAPPALRTRSLPGAQVGLTRISCGAAQLGMTPEIPAEDSFVLALYLSDLAHHELWSHGRKAIAQGYRQNSMRIVNLEAQYSALITAPHETICIYIPRTALDGFTDDAEAARIMDLTCDPGLVDPVVANLGAALLPSFERPEETSRLFLDQITIALCSHVANRYGIGGKRRPVPAGGLSFGAERRAKEYLAARFAEDIAVADVAAACDLSRGHFLRAFKNTTGVTPHKWLQRHRIEQAKRLLAEPTAGIAEIALKCGFADQSHLTRVFSQFTGTSPAAWRRANQGRQAGED